jgi:hypothetical protein
MNLHHTSFFQITIVRLFFLLVMAICTYFIMYLLMCLIIMPCPLSPCCDRVVSGHRMGGGKGLVDGGNYVLFKFGSGSRQTVCDNHVWARAMSCGDSSEFPTLYTIVR